MMGLYFILNFLAVCNVVSTLPAFTPDYGNQHHLGLDNTPGVEASGHDHSRYKCDLPRPIDPSKDGLVSSQKIFSGEESLETMVKRHQSLVRIASVCYDDLGSFDEDDRWKPFYEIPGTLEEHYPNVYKYASFETINKFGLVYTVEGSDNNLAPILLTAHQDVVPVEAATLDQWDYPPFDAYYNETDGYLYGRGASDDKAAITALMSSLDALLSQEGYVPRRSVVLAFGFDGECAGQAGAGEIAKHLEDKYGEDGIAVILDQGGGGLRSVGETLYALPAVYEKGYLDVWFDLTVLGGHSSTPPPNTAIGIMSEIVTALESNSYKPKIDWNSPVHQGLVCLARYSPDALPELTHMVRHGDLQSAAYLMSHLSRETQYAIQTSQAIDWISGGAKINALPEFVTLGVNHRYAPQDSIGKIQHRIVQLVEDIVDRHGIRLQAFKDDEDYEQYVATHAVSPRHKNASHAWKPTFNGNLLVESRLKSPVSRQSPTSGNVWDVFAGTARHTFSSEASKVVVAPGAMTGNTDSRHYLNLSKNIYRWSPGSLSSFDNIYTVNERLLMREQLNMAKFYYDFIRNYDQADD
ncbi:hypothetical protein F4808DRAFT_359176 [Astrocystis sublimbata]|nr:hypothetical protein F4808DRAFT_359176 [Astrocystis sublimbata]